MSTLGTHPTAEDLRAPLLLAAAGHTTLTAAVELLADHALWLNRRDFRHYIDIFHDPHDNTTAARILWSDLPPALMTGKLPCSASEEAILTIAMSLADPTCRVSLHDALFRLDATNTTLVARAFARATGTTPA